MRPGYAVLGLGYADVGLGYVVLRFFPLKVLFKHLSGSALVSLRGLGLGRGAFGHVGLQLGYHT